MTLVDKINQTIEIEKNREKIKPSLKLSVERYERLKKQGIIKDDTYNLAGIDVGAPKINDFKMRYATKF